MAKKEPEPQDPRVLQHFKRGAELEMLKRLMKTSGIAKKNQTPRKGRPWKAGQN